MSADTYQGGLRNILEAIDGMLADRRVEGARVVHDNPSGDPESLNVTITVGDKSASESFGAAEIHDCGLAIDAPAAVKVRMLVGQFVR